MSENDTPEVAEMRRKLDVTFVWFWTNGDGSIGELRGEGEHQQDAFTKLTKEQREQVTRANGCRKVLTKEYDFVEYINAIHSGARVEIDEEMFYYWLEVLPPIYMRRVVKLPYAPEPAPGQPATTITATFGFAEGAEKIVAFWASRGDDQYTKHYFAQRTDEMNPRA